MNVDLCTKKVITTMVPPQTEHLTYVKDRLQFSDDVTGTVSGDPGDLCLLEIKTRAHGSLEPLAAVTGSHVAQVQLQLECAEVKICVLQ